MIDHFSGEYRFLSNFWPCRVQFCGHTFPSVEHAYVYAKADDPQERKIILERGTTLTAAQIKKIGKKLTIRPNWNAIKVQIMRELIFQKFSLDNVLKEKLRATAPHTLVEGNEWHDTFWGVCNGKGLNWLGVLLMEMRDNLQGDEQC